MRWNPTGLARLAALVVAAITPAAEASAMRRASLTSRVETPPPSAVADRLGPSAGLDGFAGVLDASSAALGLPSRGDPAGPAVPPIDLPPSSRLGRDEPILAHVEAPRRREVVKEEGASPSRHLPEPGSFILLATGVVGLALRRRMRRQHEVPAAAAGEAAAG